MCRSVFTALLVCVIGMCDTASGAQYAYQVNFTDKNNTPYSLSSPLAYLSPRAMARRTMQGISVDSTDLPVNRAYVDSVLALTGGVLHESSRWLNMCVILVSDSTQIHALAGKSFIKSTKYLAFYGFDIHHKPLTQPVVPAAKTTSGNTYYYNTWDQTQIVNGNFLHDEGFKGGGKLIAVLDAGFTYTDVHPGFDSLRMSGRLVDVHNFTLASSNVYSYDIHGTEVLSTMAGYVPGTYVGSAPLASYALYVTEDGGGENLVELVNMLCGAERADSIGADVITTSLGYNTFDDASGDFNFATDFDGKTTTAAQAANLATKKGMLFIASAGNEGAGSWHMILTPGDADSALTIGSVTAAGVPFTTSGYGPNAAGQVKPDVCTLGQPGSVFVGTNSYGQAGGTSISTPQIAGWAACLWEANPTATPYIIRQGIIKCASSYATPTDHIGYGIPNFMCTEQVVGVKEAPVSLTQNNWVAVTPNPFSGTLKLEVNANATQRANFTISDMAGRIICNVSQDVYAGRDTPVTIGMPEAPAGIYILRAATATQCQVIKIEKN